MSRVETLRGAVDSAELGFTLVHEHVLSHIEGLLENFPSVCDLDEERERCRRQLMRAHGVGVRTIVDHTVMGLGRNVPRLLQIGADLPINIVIATGVYYHEELPRYFQQRSIDALADLFCKDIAEGIQGTSVKAGVIKGVIDRAGLTPDIEKQLRAAARAHRRTGAVLSTHTNGHTRGGADQQAIFREEGVDLRRVLIGHVGDSEDLDYLKDIMDSGSFAGMDRFGFEPTPMMEKYGFLPVGARIRVIAELCRHGYSDRMVLSHDACAFFTFLTDELYATMFPNNNWTYIPTQVVPALREAGVSATDIIRMTVENPRRLFEINGRPY